MKLPAVALVAAATLAIAGCSSVKPTLYPNDQYNRVGSAKADEDVAACQQQAEAYVKSGGSSGPGLGETARNTGVGAAVGGGQRRRRGRDRRQRWGGCGDRRRQWRDGRSARHACSGWMFQPSQPDPTVSGVRREVLAR